MKLALLLVLTLSMLAGCRMYSPDAGHEIVLVEKPMIFGHGGIDPEPVKTGLSITAPTTEGVDVYMQPFKYETQLDDTMTKTGFPSASTQLWY